MQIVLCFPNCETS